MNRPSETSSLDDPQWRADFIRAACLMAALAEISGAARDYQAWLKTALVLLLARKTSSLDSSGAT